MHECEGRVEGKAAVDEEETVKGEKAIWEGCKNVNQGKPTEKIYVNV